MQKNTLGLIVAGILLLVAGAYIVHLRSENDRPKDMEAKKAALPAVSLGSTAAPRVLTPEQRKAMLDKLAAANASTPHGVWFATAPNNSEAVNFQKQIQSVFEEAGWKVLGNEPVTFSLKPGIFFFMAEED